VRHTCISLWSHTSIICHRPRRDRGTKSLRGRAEGRFRTDLPVSGLVTILHTVTHAAATAVYNGEMTAEDALRTIAATMLGMTTSPGHVVPDRLA
jgi:TetR/AcrR family transcriptional repressor of mexCD-oprJ operon